MSPKILDQTYEHLLVYTMTDGLGDYLILGDLIRKAEANLPNTYCIIIHRGNPHVDLWPEGDAQKRFFDISSIFQISALAKLLRVARLRRVKVFALQMAPGSLQGFIFYLLLKQLRLVDYIVDFNLINADIITPPLSGAYILHMHLDQLRQLFGCSLPESVPGLKLPLKLTLVRTSPHDQMLVGIHPWTRRASPYLMWQDEKWLDVVAYLITYGATPVVIGKDKRFDQFGQNLIKRFGEDKVILRSSSTVSELVQTVASCSLLVSLNSSVIHIAYAYGVRSVVLSGPHLSFWTPKWQGCIEIRDRNAIYPPSDECKTHDAIPKVFNIPVSDVTFAINSLLSDQG